MTSDKPAGAKDPDEVLKGAKAIGPEVGLFNTDQTFYHLKKGHILGVRKMGRLWVGTRRNIRLTVAA
jgi:hypothetical protein